MVESCKLIISCCISNSICKDIDHKIGSIGEEVNTTEKFEALKCKMPNGINVVLRGGYVTIIHSLSKIKHIMNVTFEFGQPREKISPVFADPNLFLNSILAFKGLLAYVCLYELYCISLLFSQSSWKAGKERDVIGSVQKDALKHGGDNTDLHMQQHRNLGKLSSRSQDLGPARGHLEEGKIIVNSWGFNSILDSLREDGS